MVSLRNGANLISLAEFKEEFEDFIEVECRTSSLLAFISTCEI